MHLTLKWHFQPIWWDILINLQVFTLSHAISPYLMNSRSIKMTDIHNLLIKISQPAFYLSWLTFLLPLCELTVPTFTCHWFTSFLTDRRQQVRLEKITSSIQNINSTHARDVCSPYCSLLQHKQLHLRRPSNLQVDTMVIDLIPGGDESAYRCKVKQLAPWCSQNNLELNMLKTVEITVEFRRDPQYCPLLPYSPTLSAVDSGSAPALLV